MKKKMFYIGGMHCAACSSSCERALLRLDGVSSAAVNLATTRAAVEYDETKLRYSDLKRCIEKNGFRILEQQQLIQDEKKEQKAALLRLIVALSFAVPLFLIAMLPMLFNWTVPFPILYVLVQLLLTIPVIWSGFGFYTRGFSAFLHGRPNMDSLVAVATSSAFLYSLYLGIRTVAGAPPAHLYFESTAMILSLVQLGKYMEMRSKHKMGQAIAGLTALTPRMAHVIRDGAQTDLPAEDLVEGDAVLVKAGERFPCDGRVTAGASGVDESMLTGESIPVEKTVGNTVYAGTINRTGTLTFVVTKIGEETALGKMISLVQDAAGSKAPIARIADIVSGYFVLVVLAIACLSAILWWIGGKDFSYVLNIFVSVLVVACPCAMGLATPTAIVVATGRGAKMGILFKNAEALERLQEVRTVVFDKTGTLTSGKLRVDAVHADDLHTLLAAAYSLENLSEHPISAAVASYCADAQVPLLQCTDFAEHAGYGLSGTVDGHAVLVGNAKLLMEHRIPIPFDDAAEMTVVYVAQDGVCLGWIAVADTVKEDSATSVAALKAYGIRPVLLTGDHRRTAEKVAATVGIDTVYGDMLPEQKVDVVRSLQGHGTTVAMAGDGINDAASLTVADVGVSVGSGMDIAVDAADVVLMHDRMTDLVRAFALSRVTMRVIRQNLFWAFAYNAVGIPFAAGLLALFGGPMLSPMFAALAMSCSSVTVITNALRLNRISLGEV